MKEPEEVQIAFVEEETQTIAVTLLKPNVYRLEWTPVIFAEEGETLDLHFGDIVETRPLPDHTLRFLRVLERGQFRHYDWLVPEQFVNSVQYDEFNAAVKAAGGTCEVIMGGWLLVHVPPASRFDANAELNRRIAAAMDQTLSS